ncbi:hypothetical protein M514_20452 [Trichuris suis]|uniref:Uncharacterized protein n=1 Tax=Trichuris suis TaxID=68888 RepID=A0A085ND70_9BILA|nr:hypothetical protein M514_20452 [Trichuris suis]
MGVCHPPLFFNSERNARWEKAVQVTEESFILTGLRDGKYVIDVTLEKLTLRPSDILVSYDVKDLFTSIPMDITLNALENLLDKDSTLSQRTSLKAFHVKKLVS